MFLKSCVADVSDEEFELLVNPHGDRVHKYIEACILPEVISFYLATGYYKNCVYQDSLDIHINSIIAELFNGEYEERETLKSNIKKVLYIKYGLIVINESPLDFAQY